MIRDEFKNADKKTIQKKANKKMLEMGEREYYAKRMSKINELFGPVKFSTLFCLVCFLLLSALYILNILIVKGYKIEWHCYAVLAFTALLVLWTICWFAVLVPYLKKKVEFYKSELSRLSREYVLKHTGK